MDKLKPCPFCGGEAYVDYAIFDSNDWGVCCKGCSAYIEAVYPDEDTEENAIKAWNRRASDA